MDDPIIYDVAAELLACACAALEATTAGCPARATVVAGEAAWDDCCEGQLTVSVPTIFPSTTFPDPDTRNAVCGPPFTAFDVDVEIVRCAPTVNSSGRAPSVADLNASALIWHLDARAVWTGVLCCLHAHRLEWNSVVRQQIALGPEGGCVGSRLTVTVGLTDCVCPEF